MRQILVVKVNAADLAAIRGGQPLVIERADGGAAISVEFERGGGVALSHVESSLDGAGPAPSLVEKKAKCPYCNASFKAIKSHIYNKHPGKSLSTTGPKCRYCAKRFDTPNAVMRHEVRSHPKEFVGVTGQKGVRTQQVKARARTQAKEAQNA